MSSISGVGGGIGLSQFYPSVSGASQSSSTTATTAANSSLSTSSTDGSTSGQQVHGRHHHGHHGDGGNSQLFSQLQSAVSSALQSATQGGTDPNQAIEDAIEKVFQNNNSATSPNGTSTSSTPNGDAASANTPLSTTGDTPGSNGSSGLQAFFQTLQNAGIDPQQFHQDFLTAVQSAQNGGATNPSLAFQSLPPGSIIDTTG